MPRVGQAIAIPPVSTAPETQAPSKVLAPVIQSPPMGAHGKPIELRDSQVKILHVLADAPMGLCTRHISERSRVEPSMVARMLGSEEIMYRRKFEKDRNCLTLLSWKYVRCESVVIDYEVSEKAERIFFITESGRECVKSIDA
jgi:hypothetical protein